jgi:hypothetical protein
MGNDIVKPVLDKFNETYVALGLIALSLLLSSLPYIAAWAWQPTDRQFMGIIGNVPDWTQYLSWMKSSETEIIISNKLTAEPQNPAFFNLQWFVLGRIRAGFGLSVDFVLQAFRLVTSAGFMWFTYRLCQQYFVEQPWARWLAWILVNFTAGFGYVWVVEKWLTGTMEYPLDVYVAEPVSFQNMIIYPHFLLAVILMLGIFQFALRAMEKGRWPYSLISGFLGLILGLTHAYDLIIVYAVLGGYTGLVLLRDGWDWRPVSGLLAVFGLSFPPAAYFLYLTTTDPVWRAVLGQFDNAGVFTPDPLHLIILLGLPFLLAALTFDGFFPLAERWGWGLLLRVWFLVNLPLAYIPTDFQIHMLSGWQVPIGILAAEGVFKHLLPALQSHSWLRQYVARIWPRATLMTARWLTVGVLALAVVPHNGYLWGWRILDLSRLHHDQYLYVDEVQALQWLSANTQPSEVVLSALTLGQYIPALAGNTVYLGHWAQTVDFFEKQNRVREFFQPQTANAQRLALLTEYNVRYVIIGRAERKLGSVDPETLDFLQLAFKTSETRIYRVKVTD